MVRVPVTRPPAKLIVERLARLSILTAKAFVEPAIETSLAVTISNVPRLTVLPMFPVTANAPPLPRVRVRLSPVIRLPLMFPSTVTFAPWVWAPPLVVSMTRSVSLRTRLPMTLTVPPFVKMVLDVRSALPRIVRSRSEERRVGKE